MEGSTPMPGMTHDMSNLQSMDKSDMHSMPEAMNMKMPGMPESMKGISMEKLAAAKGEEFDLMFIDMMSQHHMGAIKWRKQPSQNYSTRK
jgi:uncharacterized protein (DUF305 family)